MLGWKLLGQPSYLLCVFISWNGDANTNILVRKEKDKNVVFDCSTEDNKNIISIKGRRKKTCFLLFHSRPMHHAINPVE